MILWYKDLFLILDSLILIDVQIIQYDLISH